MKLCAESIADMNTDTFTKSIGDTLTSILLPILLMLLPWVLPAKRHWAHTLGHVPHISKKIIFSRYVLQSVTADAVV